MQDTERFAPQLTSDGSFTFFSAEFGQTFHSYHGARQEADLKFVLPTDLARKAIATSVSILDICYGLGYNTAAALETIWAVNPNCRVEWIGLEIDTTVAMTAIAHQLLDSWPDPIPQLLTQLASDRQLQTDRFDAHLLLGDARESIQAICQTFCADAIFLDPFSPPSCPQLWTVEFLTLVARCLKPDGYLATYSCSAAVRSAMIAAGLEIGSTPPVGRRSPGTIASFTSVDLPKLSQQEQEHLRTRAAVPYRDPGLRNPTEVILQRRQIEQKASTLEPSSHWKKRWFSHSTRENAE